MSAFSSSVVFNKKGALQKDASFEPKTEKRSQLSQACKDIEIWAKDHPYPIPEREPDYAYHLTVSPKVDGRRWKISVATTFDLSDEQMVFFYANSGDFGIDGRVTILKPEHEQAIYYLGSPIVCGIVNAMQKNNSAKNEWQSL